MRASELRIGNYYNYDCDSIKLDGSFLAAYLQNECDYILEPIPLTGEWIVKFGLSKENGYPYKFNNGFLKIRNGIFFFKYHDIEVELQFVHQLQNLYFALTGKEL